MRKKQVKMTSAELVEARRTLEWGRERMSGELGLLPAELEAYEAGSLAVPADTAWLVRAMLATREQGRVLQASGLAECPRAAALHDALEAAVDRGGVRASEREAEALLEHAEACGVCRARTGYLKAHAPPLPPPEMGWSGRALGALAVMTGRLGRLLRLPEGPRGEFRRASVFIAAVLSGIAVAVSAAGLVLGIASGRASASDAGAWLTLLAVLVPAYFVGAILAGAAWDATRGIRHRLAGYVARGAATAAALYGAVGLTLPFIPEQTMSLSQLPGLLVLLAVLGALFGAGKWARDRAADNLPDPPRERAA